MSLKQSTIGHLTALLARCPELEYLRDDIHWAAEHICGSYIGGGKVLVCGNGGSAADSDHIVGELMKGFVLKRELLPEDIEKIQNTDADDWQTIANRLQRGVPAIALTQHPALSSAIANDTDASMIYAQQVYVLGQPADVLIGISTSGNAANVINALKVAKAFGIVTIGFTGSRVGRMDDFCDVMIKAPVAETFRVQEYHLPIYHVLCLMIEEELFG
ncbi:MAG: SIS domain-containing protein [Armatimonadota bacterium]|nr:SIS domain-containing protein [bacterium]